MPVRTCSSLCEVGDDRVGWGLPLAIGAKVARPVSPVVALVGDGGFAHSRAEIETMVRSHVAVVVIVLNNGVLGFQKDAETVKFGRYTSACHFRRWTMPRSRALVAAAVPPSHPPAILARSWTRRSRLSAPG